MSPESLLILLFLMVLPVRAAVNRRVQSGDGFWDQAANGPGSVPTAEDDVVIEPEGVTVIHRHGSTAVANLEARGAVVLDVDA